MNDIQQSSISAYNEEVKSGKIPSQRRRIEHIIKKIGPLTRNEIRKYCSIENGVTHGQLPRIPMSSVCGRVRCLIDSNLIHVCDHKEDPVTRKRVQVLAYGPAPKKQYEMSL